MGSNDSKKVTFYFGENTGSDSASMTEGQLRRQLLEKENEVKKLESKKAELETLVNNLHQEIKRLSIELRELKKKDLENANSTAVEVTDLKNKVEILKAENIKLADKNLELKKKDVNNHTVIKNLCQRIETKKQVEKAREVKVSLIMMSYLYDYPGARSKPIPKFHRAVRSFMNQTYQNKELIIVSDGCDITVREYQEHWSDVPNIKLVQCKKSSYIWPGSQRQKGIGAATGDWIGYLDTDDIIHPDHIQNVINEIMVSPNAEVLLNQGYARMLGIFDTDPNMLKMGENKSVEPIEILPIYETSDLYRYATIDLSEDYKLNQVFGSSRTFHKKDIPVKWIDSNKRGEDVRFSTMLKTLKNKTINTPTYIVCHVPKIIDL